MHGRRLLILDDEPTVGQTLLLGAQACGFEARLCDTVPDFLDASSAWQPSHLAIDLTLPGTSGAAVLTQLAQAACRARVFIYSGAGAAECDAALAEAARLGLAAAGVLPKPFRLATLRQMLAA